MSIDRLKTSTKLFILVRPSVVYSLKMIFAFIEGLYFAVLAEVKSINVRRGFNINKRICTKIDRDNIGLKKFDSVFSIIIIYIFSILFPLFSINIFSLFFIPMIFLGC